MVVPVQRLEYQVHLCRLCIFLHISRASQVGPFIRMLSPLLISALSDLLDQDSEMQRALGVADSFDSASTNQAPSCRFFILLLNIFFSHRFGPQSPKWQNSP